jgi:hypothetical protein
MHQWRSRSEARQPEPDIEDLKRLAPDSDPAAGHRTVHVTPCIPLGHVLPLVGLLLAQPDPDQDLRPSSKEVDLQRHDGGIPRSNLIRQLLDLPAVSEESADTIRVMLAIRSCRRIFGDVDPMKAQGEWLDLGPDPSLGNADLPVTDRLDLGSAKLDTALQGLADQVGISSPPVLDDRFIRFFIWRT